MDDSISRQAAIDEIDEWIKAFRENGHKESAADARLIQNGIIQLPSAQTEPQWIPCSERLPEVGQDVLFSVKDIYVSEGCLRDDGDWWQFRWNAVQSEKVVTAWMPLPEPYTESEEEDGGSNKQTGGDRRGQELLRPRRHKRHKHRGQD